MSLLLWVCSAHAAPSVLVGAGVEGSTNDPFARKVGARVAFGVEWRPWLQTRAVAVAYPTTGELAYTQLTRQIVNQNQVFPDLSLPTARGQIAAAFPALRARSGGVNGSVGPEIGVGVVYTVDQLALIGKEGEASALATAREWHPTVSVGLVGEIGGRAHGIEVRAERSSYVETVDGFDERKGDLWLGLAWVWHPGRAE
jgi:hypothetical protein